MPPDSDNPDLDERRIQLTAHERRALLRGRFRFGLFTLICIAGAAYGVQLFIAALNAQQKWTMPTGDLIAAVALVFCAFQSARLARRFHNTLQQSQQSPPTKPPDFTPLSDGSQHARKLDEMK